MRDVEAKSSEKIAAAFAKMVPLPNGLVFLSLDSETDRSCIAGKK